MRKIRSFRWFSQIFADFRFSWELQHFGGADFRRKPQETADFHRKPQETVDFRRNPFVPFSLSLLVPPYIHENPRHGIRYLYHRGQNYYKNPLYTNNV